MLAVLVVGVLFSNLFVGMLMNTFQYGEEMQQSERGAVCLALYTTATSYLSHEETEELLWGLGNIAQMLHFSTDRLCAQRLKGKWFAYKVKLAGGVEAWSKSLLHRVRRLALSSCAEPGFQAISGQVKRSLIARTAKQVAALSSSGLDVKKALKRAYEDCGLCHTSTVSQTHELVMNENALQLTHELLVLQMTLVRSFGQQLGFNASHTDNLVQEAEHRLKTHMNVNMRRKLLSKRQQRDYRSQPSPEEV